MSTEEKENIREKWQECYEDFDLLFADGFDEAIIGVDVVQMRVCYDVDKCIEILCKEDFMELEDAVQYFDYNVLGAYVGEQTPLYIKTKTDYFID